MKSWHFVAGLAILLGSCKGNDTGPSTTGSLVIFVSTSGTGLDANGYQVTLTGQTSHHAATQDTVAYVNIPPGEYLVGLTDVATNCVGGAAVPASVPEGGVDSIALHVTCTATTGTLTIRLTTSGVALDPDGYGVQIDANGTTAVGINATTTALVLPVGGHTVTLSGVVENCTPDVAGPYPVTLTPAESDTLALGIICDWPRVAVRLGTTAGIALINPDGTNEQGVLSSVSGEDHKDQAWSIDHTKLAVDRVPVGGLPTRVIGIVDPDSAPTTTIIGDTLPALRPRWRPDGTAILEISADSVGGNAGVFVRPISGSTKTRVTPDSLKVTSADWSPDGGEIAFTAADTVTGALASLWVIGANGTGLTRISPDSLGGMGFVRWSPDGNALLFTIGSNALWTISPAGASPTRVSVAGYGLQFTASWSPDGSEIMIGGIDLISGASRLLVIAPDGTIHAAMARPGSGGWLDPDWR